jgi:hypothetical protein
LANDIVIFYAPPEMCEDGGPTVMEMVCASTCLTAIICFSMEVKHGNMFDSQLHMQRHRVGARGNATTFLLPWENMLAEMQGLEGNAEHLPVVPDLPRSGSQLAYVVQVLLKTNDEEKQEFLKSFILQANANRDKVVRCILGMRARGHRAYVRPDEGKVREKTQQLPTNGIPPELISVLPNDNSFEKLHVQMAATLVAGMKDPDKIKQSFKDERPNAVVLERSSAEGADIEERRTSALFSLGKQLQGINHGQPVQKYDWKMQAQSRADAFFQAWQTLHSCRSTLDRSNVGLPVSPNFSISSSVLAKASRVPGKKSAYSWL